MAIALENNKLNADCIYVCSNTSKSYFHLCNFRSLKSTENQTLSVLLDIKLAKVSIESKTSGR